MSKRRVTILFGSNIDISGSAIDEPLPSIVQVYRNLNDVRRFFESQEDYVLGKFEREVLRCVLYIILKIQHVWFKIAGEKSETIFQENETL